MSKILAGGISRAEADIIRNLLREKPKSKEELALYDLLTDEMQGIRRECM